MNIGQIATLFNRALLHTFSLKKNLLVFLILALSGILIVFFRALAWGANEWVRLSLTFLPIFLCGGVLLSLGVLLIRIYHDEVKNKSFSYKDILFKSWEAIVGASYFSIPLILAYLLLWMLLGVFVLLRGIPIMGEFISTVLSFAPFLINLTSLLLCFGTLLLLFFVSPVIALKGMDRGVVFQTVIKRVEKDPFTNIILLLISLLPLVFVLTFLLLATLLTESICFDCYTLPQIILKWFFLMIPFVAFLTPAIIFFFNFAAEAHVKTRTQ